MTAGSPVHYKQNRLKQLRAFCQVTQCGSISKAADKLFSSQPAISLQIQALERELDTILFERRGPRIKITPDGELLYQLALPLVEGIDGLADSFAALRGNLDSGELNIAAGESTILYILPQFIKRFRDTYPGIQIKLHNVTGRDGLAMLRNDEVDLAVGSMLEEQDDIVYKPFCTFSPALICSRDHPLTRKKNLQLHDISPHGLILPPRHLSTWRIVEMAFSQHNADYSVALEAGGWEVIKKYVELGLGVSIVTDVCLTGDEKLAVIPLDKYFPQRSYGIVLRRGRFLRPQAQRFIDMINEHGTTLMSALHDNNISA